MIVGHGGNVYQVARRLGCSPRDIIDMSSNVNPLGPPPGLKEFLRESLDVVDALPEVAADSAVQAFADRFHLDPRRVIPGNGTTQMIYSLPDALHLKKVLILGPTYSDYGDACNLHGTACRYLMCEKRRMTEGLSDALAIRFFQSRTSFLLARLSEPLTADVVCDALLDDRILIRDCSNFIGLSSRYIRISIKTAEANALAVQGLLNIDREVSAAAPLTCRTAAR